MTVLTLSTIQDQFGSLESITQLSYKDRQLTRVDQLEPLIQLNKLDLSLNQLSNISYITSTSTLNIAWLNLANNKLASINNISNLTQLKVINIGYNTIDNINELTNCKLLVAVIANNNNITQIPAALPVTLNTLILSHNSISECKSVSTLTRLTKLSLSYNQLHNIPTELQLCTELAELRLNHNMINTLPATLQYNQRIKIIDVSYNHIAALNDIIVLNQLPYLRNLSLQGNMIADTNEYTSIINKLCPLLSVIDSHKSNRTADTNTNHKPNVKSKHVLVDENNQHKKIKLSSTHNTPGQSTNNIHHKQKNTKQSDTTTCTSNNHPFTTNKSVTRHQSSVMKPVIPKDLKFISSTELIDTPDNTTKNNNNSIKHTINDNIANNGMVTIIRPNTNNFSLDELLNNSVDMNIGTGNTISAWD